MKEIMRVNGREYEIRELLGKGKGGYSYLAWDGEKEYVLKQIHHEPCDYYQFGDKLASELRDYETLRGVGIPMPEMMDVDHEHERILKEYIRGDTVSRMVLEDRLPEACLDQVRAMCEKLYPAGINIDYFPTNFVLKDGILYYIDYECNRYSQEWDFEHWGIQYWSKTPTFLEYAREHGM